MSGFEQIELEIQWKKILDDLSKNFGDLEDVKDVVFLVGVQELGSGFRKFSKDEKIDLMHIGLCRLLTPYGYFEYDGHDKEGWPHYKILKELPSLTEKENESLMKEAIVEYFRERA